jgi:hypothetical protein
LRDTCTPAATSCLNRVLPKFFSDGGGWAYVPEVRRREFVLPALRNPARAEPLAWSLVVALLLQLWVGVPLALQMSAALQAEAGWAEAHCGGGEEGQPHPSAPGDPAQHRGHDHCLICKTAAAPVLLAAAVLASFIERDVVALNGAAPSAPDAQTAPLAYRSRAPPFIA